MRSAKSLWVLSQQIRSLESELGLKLLERNSRGVQLTPEGQAFLREAQIVIQHAEERMLIAVSEGAGITMLLAGRTATLRFPGVVYRRFTDPEPTGVLALAYHQPTSLPARRFVDLAVEVARR